MKAGAEVAAASYAILRDQTGATLNAGAETSADSGRLIRRR